MLRAYNIMREHPSSLIEIGLSCPLRLHVKIENLYVVYSNDRVVAEAWIGKKECQDRATSASGTSPDSNIRVTNSM
jgi:hypothetical protein